MKHLVPNSPMIELVEADLQGSPISRFVKKGGGLHHLCYEVDSLEEQLQMALDCGGILIAAPQPAIAFGGNSIAWVCTRERLLVEYLQRSSNGKL